MARLVYVLLQSPLLATGSGAPRDMMTHPDLRFLRSFPSRYATPAALFSASHS